MHLRKQQKLINEDKDSHPVAGQLDLFSMVGKPLPTSFEGGADIRYIQAMLGHAELTTTQIYAQVSVRALQAVHAATHPAAANTPRTARNAGDDAGHDGHGERKVAVSELLAALEEEGDQEENRPPAASPGGPR
jgi:hypothetical protein